MGHGSKRVFLASLCLVALAARTYGNPVPSALDGQGGATSSITGVVQDAAGGVIPGATVVVSQQRDRDEVSRPSPTPRARSTCRRFNPEPTR